MAPLHGALALTEVNDVAVRVADELNFDVARIDDEFLQIDLIAAEGPLRLAGRIADGRLQLLFGIHPAHPFSAATGRCLQHHRITELPGHSPRIVDVCGGLLGAGDHGNPNLFRQPASLCLRTERPNGLRGRADEHETLVRARSGKLGVFAQKTVTGVDRIGSVPPGGVENTVEAEIALARRRSSDVSSFVSQPNVECFPIGVRVHSDAADAELAKRAYQTDGNLAAIGDEDLAKQLA